MRRRHVVSDGRGRPLLVVPDRSWEDYLQLAVSEIRDFGVTSVQVCRRLRALLDGLLETVQAGNRAAVTTELRRLDAAGERTFGDPDQRAFAMIGDRQGTGPGPGTGPGTGIAEDEASARHQGPLQDGP